MSEKPNTSSGSEMPVRTVSQKFSYPLRGEIFQRNDGADQQRLQISDLHFDKFTFTSHVRLVEDKISRPRYVLVRKFPTEADAMDQRSGDG